MTQPVEIPFCADAGSPLLRRSAKRERAKRARSNAAGILRRTACNCRRQSLGNTPSRSGAKAVETGLADTMRQTGRPARGGRHVAGNGYRRGRELLYGNRQCCRENAGGHRHEGEPIGCHLRRRRVSACRSAQIPSRRSAA